MKEYKTVTYERYWTDKKLTVLINSWASRGWRLVIVVKKRWNLDRYYFEREIN